MSVEVFGLRYGQTKPFEECVVRNGWPANVFGRALCFSDLGVIEIASIEKGAQPYGSVLILAEEEANSLRFGYRESFEHEATEDQLSALEEIADIDGESIPNQLRKRAESYLPALFLADIAISADGIHFRDGRYKQKYESVLNYWSKSLRAIEDESHRDFNADVRSHLLSQDFDLSDLPQAQLDDQQRETMRNKIVPEINELYTRAQLLRRVELSTSRFAIEAARHAITATQ